MHTRVRIGRYMQKLVGNGYVQPGIHNKRFLFLVGLIDEHGSNLALRVGLVPLYCLVKHEFR